MMARFTWVTEIDGTDVKSLVLEDGRIEYGRASLFEQPGPPYAILNLLTRDSYPAAAELFPEFGLGNHSMDSGFTDLYSDTYEGPVSRMTLGAPVSVRAVTESGFTDLYHADYDAGMDLTRFTGYVQAIDYTWDRIRLTCLPDTEAWARINVGGTSGSPIAAEPDVHRVQRLCTEAGVTITIDGADGPQVIAIPADTAATGLTQQLTDIATQTGGLLYTDRDGDVHYRTFAWTPPASTTIPAGITLRDPLGMTLDLGLVRNSIVVEYGDADPKATVTASDSTSISRYGLREGKYTSQISGTVAAQAYADWLLASLDADWQLPNITVGMNLATDTQIATVAALEQGSPVTIPTLLAGSPEPSYDSILLGYSEGISQSDWTITLHLSPTDAQLPGVAA